MLKINSLRQMTAGNFSYLATILNTKTAINFSVNSRFMFGGVGGI
jgi:hypothetical protein